MLPKLPFVPLRDNSLLGVKLGTKEDRCIELSLAYILFDFLKLKRIN
jgi:hypothetical protein